MKGMKKKGRCIALAGSLVLVGASFAYWNQTSTIDNPFDTGKYGATISEDFKPSEGENWQPGVEVNKDVVVDNEGDQDIIVRVRLDETWTRKNESDPYKDSKNDPFDVYQTSQSVADDGLTTDDGSVVTKTLSSSTNWIDGGDGWYYYKENLAGGTSTDKWLDSVELLDETDMGKLQTVYYVTASDDANPKDWVWYSYTADQMPSYIDASGAPCFKDDAGAQMVLHNKTETGYVKDGNNIPLMGYGDSDYVLTITSQTVQATQEAIDEVFNGGSAFTAPTGTNWSVK